MEAGRCCSFSNCVVESNTGAGLHIYDPDTGRITIYYGAADTYTAMAFCYVDEVIEYIKKHHEDID